MLTIVNGQSSPSFNGAMGAMFEDRKRVFVDLLNWSVPVVEDRYEVDQFDGPAAVYMLVTEPGSDRHLGSVRLLTSEQPHILGDIFPQLAQGGPPRGPGIWEITRLCLSPALASLRRGMMVRRQLALGLTEFALANRIHTYTLVCNTAHVPQLLAIGWDCVPLGLPHIIEGQTLCAMAITIDATTLGRIREQGAPARRVLRGAEPGLPLAA